MALYFSCSETSSSEDNIGRKKEESILVSGLLGELSSGLSLLQLRAECLDLLLVGLLTLVGLLLGNLQRLEVVGDDPQLLLQLKDLSLSHISALLGLLQRLLQFLLKSSDPLLVLVGLALENLLGAL